MPFRTRRSHVVPEFFLKRFVQTASPKIWVGDIKNQTVFYAALSKVAVENDFYRGEGAQHEDELEDRLAVIESNAAVSLRQLDNGPPIVDPSTARFIAWLAARTGWIKRAAPHRLQAFIARSGTSCDSLARGRELPFEFQHISSGAKELVDINEATSLAARAEWRLRLTQDQFLDCIRIQAHIFATEHFPQIHWMRLTAPADSNFVTSDRPVTWEVPGLGLRDEPSALRHPAVRLLVPLSLRTALLACIRPSEMYRQGLSVKEVNSIMIRNAERYVFGSEKDDVQHIRSRVRLQSQ